MAETKEVLYLDRTILTTLITTINISKIKDYLQEVVVIILIKEQGLVGAYLAIKTIIIMSIIIAINLFLTLLATILTLEIINNKGDCLDWTIIIIIMPKIKIKESVVTYLVLFKITIIMLEVKIFKWIIIILSLSKEVDCLAIINLYRVKDRII